MCKKFFRTGVVAVILASLFSVSFVTPALADGTTWNSREAKENNKWRSVTFGDGVFVAVANGDNTNRIMTSTDGISWPFSFAANFDWQSVTYGDGVFVVLNTPNGGNRVVRSTNRGASFSVALLGLSGTWQSVTYGNGVFVAVSSTSAGGTNQQVMRSTNGGGCLDSP